LALSGALFALLLGAAIFSHVFRAWGADRWLSQALLGTGLSDMQLACLILLGVMVCACVLDAFEMIFVFIPILAPVLIAKLGDAQLAAVLLLLVLQLSFLLPPMGYAVLMARSRSGFAWVSNLALLSRVAPFAAVIVVQIGLVLALPRVVHQLDKPAVSADAAESAADLNERMQSLGGRPGRTARDDDSAATTQQGTPPTLAASASVSPPSSAPGLAPTIAPAIAPTIAPTIVPASR
jgi:hypothetical protein